MNQMRTFKCDMGDGVVCEMSVPETKPETAQEYKPQMRWSKRPSKKHIPQYVNWVNSVNQTTADSWGVGLIHIFQLERNPAGWVVWKYQPNSQPKRVPFGDYLKRVKAQRYSP